MIAQFLLSIVFILFVAEAWFRRRLKNYPPGPRPLPFIGNVLDVLPDPKICMKNIHDKYGDIVALDLGYYRVVSLKDANYVKELFNKEASNGAPLLLPNIMDYSQNKTPVGIHSLSGEKHNKVLKIVRNDVKDLTQNTSAMDFILTESTDMMVEAFTEAFKKNTQISSGNCFNMATVNVAWRLITGRKADTRDSTLTMIMGAVADFFLLLDIKNLAFFFPIFAEVAPNLTGWRAVKEKQEFVRSQVDKCIAEHEKSLDTREERTGNLMDTFYEHIQRTTDPDSSLYKEFGHANARGTYVGILFAAIETTAAALSWLILYMLKTPGAQERIQQEIDEIIGPLRKPSVADRDRMPYTKAFILEVLRLAPTLPTGLPHRLVEDVEFRGYKMLKDTIVFANIYDIHQDKAVWGPDAEDFKPERFLDGTFKPNDLLTFSAGKRSCPGAPFAKIELFFFFVSILQNFKITADDPENISMESSGVNLLHKPAPFNFRAIPR